jgi:Spy/CpxP family protein refolding chaperone
MRKKNVLGAFLFIFLFGSISLAAVQEEEFPLRRTRESINTLMLLRMTRALELTEEQTAKIFPFMTRIEREKVEIHVKIGKELRELGLILNSKQIDQKRILEKIDSIKKLRNLLRDKDEELENYLEENLTLTQRAKYLIFSTDFYRDLREKLGRARMMQERLRKRD